MSLPKLPLALKDGNLVEINEVPSGLKCKCICPGCGEKLIAKKGNKMIHHFAHKADAFCTTALETALHLKAKKILQNANQFMLPAVRLSGKSKLIILPKLINYTKVILEKKRNNIIPDLMLKVGNKWLLLEIAVNHFAEKEKINSIRQLGLASIEIDAGSMLNTIQKGQQFFQSHRFANYLLFSPNYKTWLFNPRQQKLENQLIQSAKRKAIKTLHFSNKNIYITENCPQQKNLFKSGYKTGKSYANVFRNCLNCEACIEIQYEKYFFGSKEVNGQPKYVICSESY